MTRRKHLPPSLEASPFTRSEADAHSVPRSRLYAHDLTRPTRGVYVPESASCSELDVAWAIARGATPAWLSHTTAARAFGISVRGSQLVHVSRPPGHRAPRRPGVVGHQRKVHDDELVLVNGMCVSRPERMWMEMAQYLTTTELIVLGDQLVRIPREKYEGRTRPWTTIARLEEMLRRHGKARGSARLRAALAQIRVGSDSEPETLCRLALVAAGLPEPELQVRHTPDDPFADAADLGYPEVKLVIQYDGGHHFSAAQQARDARRDAAFEARGWTVFHVNREDLRDGFRALCERVRQFLAQRAVAA